MLDQFRHAIQNRSELKHTGGSGLAQRGIQVIDIVSEGIKTLKPDSHENILSNSLFPTIRSHRNETTIDLFSVI